MTTTEKIIAAIIVLMCAVMLARADVPLSDPILPEPPYSEMKGR